MLNLILIRSIRDPSEVLWPFHDGPRGGENAKPKWRDMWHVAHESKSPNCIHNICVFMPYLALQGQVCRVVLFLLTGILVMKPKRIACHYLRTWGCYTTHIRYTLYIHTHIIYTQYKYIFCILVEWICYLVVRCFTWICGTCRFQVLHVSSCRSLTVPWETEFFGQTQWNHMESHLVLVTCTRFQDLLQCRW